jgi:hypothetical protein
MKTHRTHVIEEIADHEKSLTDKDLRKRIAEEKQTIPKKKKLPLYLR